MTSRRLWGLTMRPRQQKDSAPDRPPRPRFAAKGWETDGTERPKPARGWHGYEPKLQIRHSWCTSPLWMVEAVKRTRHQENRPMTEPTKPYIAIQIPMMPADTNKHGTIFGGVLLSNIDLAGAIAAH